MRVTRNVHAGAFAFFLATLGTTSMASAIEQALEGAWVQGGEECTALFSGSGKAISFRKPVNVFAPAFIISGNQLRTPTASCRIKTVKKMGERRVLTLACTTSIAVEAVTAVLAPSADGTLRRYVNDADDIASTYKRCSLR